MLARNFGPTWWENFMTMLWEDYGHLDVDTWRKVVEFVRKHETSHWPLISRFEEAVASVKGGIITQIGKQDVDLQRRRDAEALEEDKRYQEAMGRFEKLADEKRAPYLAAATDQLNRLPPFKGRTADQDDAYRRRWACLEWLRETGGR